MEADLAPDVAGDSRLSRLLVGALAGLSVLAGSLFGGGSSSEPYNERDDGVVTAASDDGGLSPSSGSWFESSPIVPFLAADGGPEWAIIEPADAFASAGNPIEVWPDQLTEAQMDRVMELADVPEEWRADMRSVAWGESRWSSGAVGDKGASVGLLQLNAATWAPYCGIEVSALMDPVENARCAVAILRYEQARGYPLWSNWTVKP